MFNAGALNIIVSILNVRIVCFLNCKLLLHFLFLLLLWGWGTVGQCFSEQVNKFLFPVDVSIINAGVLRGCFYGSNCSGVLSRRPSS